MRSPFYPLTRFFSKLQSESKKLGEEIQALLNHKSAREKTIIENLKSNKTAQVGRWFSCLFYYTKLSTATHEYSQEHYSGAVWLIYHFLTVRVR